MLTVAINDALKNTYFGTIDELLLRLYFLHENSPKKCRQLLDRVDELKHCFDPSEVPSEGGSRLVMPVKNGLLRIKLLRERG